MTVWVRNQEYINPQYQVWKGVLRILWLWKTKQRLLWVANTTYRTTSPISTPSPTDSHCPGQGSQALERSSFRGGWGDITKLSQDSSFVYELYFRRSQILITLYWSLAIQSLESDSEVKEIKTLTSFQAMQVLLFPITIEYKDKSSSKGGSQWWASHKVWSTKQPGKKWELPEKWN